MLGVPWYARGHLFIAQNDFGIGNEDLIGALVLGGELVPVGLHLLAVAAPRREEPAFPP